MCGWVSRVSVRVCAYVKQSIHNAHEHGSVWLFANRDLTKILLVLPGKGDRPGTNVTNADMFARGYETKDTRGCVHMCWVHAAVLSQLPINYPYEPVLFILLFTCT